MSRRKQRVLTARERGAGIALAAATARLSQLSREAQRDLFNPRLRELAEWIDIANAARQAVTHG